MQRLIPHVAVHPCHANESLLRVDQLRALAATHNQPWEPVEHLIQHNRINLADGIHCKRDGRRWSVSELRDYRRYIYWRHNQQTVETRAQLQRQWNSTLIGEVRLWDLLQLLHFTIDHTDGIPRYTSQFVHCLQVFAGISEYDFNRWPFDFYWKRDMQLAALVHDIGKLLSLFGERDWNVDCMNRVLPGSHSPTRSCLDKLQLQWNHDEFGYSKLAALNLPPRVLRTVRFHSLRELQFFYPGYTDASIGWHKQRVPPPPPPPPARRQRPWSVAAARRRAWVAQLYGRNISLEDQQSFLEHTSAEDKRDAQFVLSFTAFDTKTKLRTETLPEVNLTEVFEVIEYYFGPGGRIVW